MIKHPMAERLAEYVPPGAVAETFVYGSLAIGVLESVRRRSKNPIVTVGTGFAFGTVGAVLNTVINHRSGAHHSPRLKDWVHKSGRIAQSFLTGIDVPTTVPEHKIHHAHTDQQLDPHSPVNEGRVGVGVHLIELIKTYDEEHHDAVVRHQDVRSHPMWSDNKMYTALGIAGTHFFAGKALGLPLSHRLISAGLHISTIYIQDATFTADSHADGHTQDVPLTPLTNIIPGGEGDHLHHHKHPLDPRHSKFDSGHVAIRALEMMGLANPHPTDPAWAA